MPSSGVISKVIIIVTFAQEKPADNTEIHFQRIGIESEWHLEKQKQNIFADK